MCSSDLGYVGMPDYQSAFAISAQTVTVGRSTVKRRAQADVAFNADPGTGQYVALTSLKTGAIAWYAYGGTSISTPQWAGLVAVSNAQRALSAKAALGSRLQQALYSVASNNANYGNAFLDVTSGRNGSCSYCTAASRYDVATGLGVPKASGLLPLLTAY